MNKDDNPYTYVNHKLRIVDFNSENFTNAIINLKDCLSDLSKLKAEISETPGCVENMLMAEGCTLSDFGHLFLPERIDVFDRGDNKAYSTDRLCMCKIWYPTMETGFTCPCWEMSREKLIKDLGKLLFCQTK